MGHSYWYVPGDWKLPAWWTDGVLVRGSTRMTHREQENFYAGRFMREVIGHQGGIYVLPRQES
ncbi:MAG: hypothetical protein ACYS7Y_34670 [Planctomycetota bacterium]|jgi:hypothetical protein